MNVSDFLRIAEVRKGRLMWFLGAGASASAGIPTAHDLTWRFKRQLYCSEERVPVSHCRNLADPVVRQRLQDHFEGRESFPPQGSPEEYASYFEAAYPDAADRRQKIEEYVSDGEPSFGHHVLAALLDEGIVRVVWTTNFDPLIEDVAGSPLPSGMRLTVADTDRPQQALAVLEEERWPLAGKLHGDFQSRRLKNTSAEIKEQDAELREALAEACRRFGLVVVGYSGRDQSIMELLTEIAREDGSFPAGLFWFHYGSEKPYPAVEELLGVAEAKGVQTGLISAGPFDELMGDIGGMFPAVHEAVRERASGARLRLTPAPKPDHGTTWPVVRFNVLPVVEWPTTARQVQCDIGGVRKVREAIESAGAEVIATRRREGVLAFGSDSEVKQVFEPYDISEWGLRALDPSIHLDLGLLSDSLSHALGGERPVRYVQAGPRPFLLADERQADGEEEYSQLRDVVRNLSGTVSGTEVGWWEAVELHLQYRDGDLWLVFVPTVFRDFTDDPEDKERAEGFIAKRLAGRFNQDWNALLDAWTGLICGERNKLIEVRTFGIGDGVDASFSIRGTTAFSRRSS